MIYWDKIPSEDTEGANLATRLRDNDYYFTHIANESGLSWSKWIVIMMAKKKRLWTSKWIPDYFIIWKNGSMIFIELKRQKKVLKNWKLWASPSVVSEEQIKWIDKLNTINNVYAEICYWKKESVQFIEKIEIETL